LHAACISNGTLDENTPAPARRGMPNAQGSLHIRIDEQSPRRKVAPPTSSAAGLIMLDCAA
jgi:hypothetical protein